MKVNHAGEFGAINICKAQLMIAELLMHDMTPMLKDFMADEK